MRKFLLPGSHCKNCHGPEGNVSVAKTEVSTVKNHTLPEPDDKFTKKSQKISNLTEKP